MAEEEDVGAVIDEGRASMDTTIERFGKELTKIRTGRASTSILDGINVDYFDTLTPLNQLATLSVPDPRGLALVMFAVGLAVYSLGGGVAVLPFKHVIVSTIDPVHRSTFFGLRLLFGGRRAAVVDAR